MIVYKNSSKGFIKDVKSNVISRKIEEAVLKSFGWQKIAEKQQSPWTNSMQFMRNVIEDADIADDCGILIEYNLPSTSLRVDFIISGTNDKGREGFIIVELKQWKEAQSTSRDGIVNTRYHGDTTHPSYQAYSYKLFLKDFNQYVYSNSIEVNSCAYLHNYFEKQPEPLRDSIYQNIVNDSPIFFGDDQAKLQDFIKKYVGNGKGENILYQIEKGNIRPSKKLVDHVNSLLKGNMDFILLDEQKVAFETAKDIALNAKEKMVVIISGGPGTGKSVLSMNLLGNLMTERNAIFVAPNASFRNVLVNKLATGTDLMTIRHLLKGSSAFYAARKNTFDVLIVDEAHRLKNEGAFMYKGKNQIEDIINAAKVSIFFIDEKQNIRPEDIGTIKEIERLADLYDAKVHKLNLTAQFRCSGAEGYINWVDDVLQLETTGNFDGWEKNDFEFRIFSSPHDLRNAIHEKANEGLHARLLAGYAWDWTAAKDGNSDGQIDDVKIPESQFQMPWNSRNTDTWAINPNGLNQIGCVHTSQGLEFDYAGVIIGKDLQFDHNNNHYYTNAKEYKDKMGKRGLLKKPKELNELVRKIYRILLTRGMKGCYVYFVDKETEMYFRKRLKMHTQ